MQFDPNLTCLNGYAGQPSSTHFTVGQICLTRGRPIHDGGSGYEGRNYIRLSCVLFNGPLTRTVWLMGYHPAMEPHPEKQNHGSTNGPPLNKQDKGHICQFNFTKKIKKKKTAFALKLTLFFPNPCSHLTPTFFARIIPTDVRSLKTCKNQKHAVYPSLLFNSIFM